MPSTRDAAIALIRPVTARLEGCRLTAYGDTGGTATIGYGHTGPEVKLGQVITQEVAEHDLDVDLAHAADEVEKVCDSAALAALDTHQRAALYDFAFNVGAGASWQIWKDIDSGKEADVPTQLLRFVNGKVGGKEQVIEGLEHRRQAEVVFWNTADADAAVAVTQTANAVQAPPSGYTRSIETPPTPQPTPPLAHASLAAKAVTVVGGVAAALGSNAQQVHDVVSPYADASPIFHTLTTVAIAGIVIAGIVGVLIHAEQTQARKT